MSKRILSCMQPTNRLQLGNYLGALRNWVKLQDEGAEQVFYGIVDLHAITVPYDHENLANATREVVAAYIAGGIDPNKSSIFTQSAVTAHSELNWLLGSMTQIGKLSRMTQFKDKAGKDKEKASLGLYAYPVLMAADILVYRATHVPVGDDQKQHLELARDIASTFNHRYGTEFFPLPEPQILGEATRVMSLKDGTTKMSKSDPSDNSRINLTDDADTIAKKIKKAKTDPEALPDNVKGLEGRPEADNLVTIYATLSNQTKEQTIQQFAGKQFSEFKPALADVAVAHLEPITSKMNELLQDKSEIDRILEAGNEKANMVANETISDVKEIMGFWKS